MANSPCWEHIRRSNAPGWEQQDKCPTPRLIQTKKKKKQYSKLNKSYWKKCHSPPLFVCCFVYTYYNHVLMLQLQYKAKLLWTLKGDSETSFCVEKSLFNFLSRPSLPLQQKVLTYCRVVPHWIGGGEGKVKTTSICWRNVEVSVEVKRCSSIIS